jgi:phospholipid transport system substrate-binding protein
MKIFSAGQCKDVKVLKGSFAICECTASATKLGAFCLRGFRALVLACLLLAPSIRPATAAPDDSVRNFVERVNEASTNLLSAEENATERCRSLLGWAFDVPAMAQYALGRAWEQSTSAERESFLAAFEDAIIAAYLGRMRDYRGATMSFVGARPPAGGDRMAASRLRLPDAEETWIWRLRPSGQSWRIVDVAIDGSSVLSSERQEYAEILAANHGDINAVIAFIRKRADRGP